MVLKKGFKNKIWVRLAGIAMVITLIVSGHILFQEEISINRSGIIIFLLAFLYLFGSLIWYFTRNNLKWRASIFILVLLFFAATVPFHLQGKMYAMEKINWFINLEYFYFLLILIPATYIGDILQKRLASPDGYEPLKGVENKLPVMLTLGVIVLWELVALYNSWLILNFIVSAALCVALWYFVKRDLQIYKEMVIPVIVLLFAGLIALTIEGKISKCPCSASYCFITTAISISLLIIMDYKSLYAEKRFSGMLIRIFAGAGSNPLMSYITFGNFLMPFFQITGLIVIYEAAYPVGYPWIGVARAFVAVLLTMSLVALMSEKKVFWKA